MMHGGGLPAVMSHLTVADNVADFDADGSGSGGGLFAVSLYENEISADNSILAGNRRNTMSEPMDDDIGGKTLVANHSLIQANPDGVTILGNHVLTNVDPLLGVLADNGGGLETHALNAGSPAIDMGSAMEAETRQQILVLHEWRDNALATVANNYAKKQVTLLS